MKIAIILIMALAILGCQKEETLNQSSNYEVELSITKRLCYYHHIEGITDATNTPIEFNCKYGDEDLIDGVFSCNDLIEQTYNFDTIKAIDPFNLSPGNTLMFSANFKSVAYAEYFKISVIITNIESEEIFYSYSEWQEDYSSTAPISIDVKLY